LPASESRLPSAKISILFMLRTSEFIVFRFSTGFNFVCTGFSSPWCCCVLSVGDHKFVSHFHRYKSSKNEYGFGNMTCLDVPGPVFGVFFIRSPLP
jgi:hypothetical protein